MHSQKETRAQVIDDHAERASPVFNNASDNSYYGLSDAQPPLYLNKYPEYEKSVRLSVRALTEATTVTLTYLFTAK